ncbi:MAG: hypothetical protein M3410_04660 [Acidobacteriota bacterium]|nr:hypothetical protein [Acidobacteriota bacterium]
MQLVENGAHLDPEEVILSHFNEAHDLGLDSAAAIKLSPEDLAAAHWLLARTPYLLETSLPGVFAIGMCAETASSASQT